MKVLVVWSINNGNVAPFIEEQVEALKSQNVDVEYFFIEKGGVVGYLSHLSKLKNKIKSFKPNIVHAHYGLAGLLCSFQREAKTIVTFHGSDISKLSNRILSYFAYKLCNSSIFVSKRLSDLLFVKSPIIIPCSVDIDKFFPLDKEESREYFELNNDDIYVLFGSSKDRPEKNYSFAKDVVNYFKKNNSLNKQVHLIELKGYTREEVNKLINACDVCILTSRWEGSPQFIKEALGSCCPIVSLDVGDVKKVIEGCNACYISEYDVKKFSFYLEKAIKFRRNNRFTNGREIIIGKNMSPQLIARRIIDEYRRYEI